jgi:ABC-type transporter Mla subunit MlaD
MISRILSGCFARSPHFVAASLLGGTVLLTPLAVSVAEAQATPPVEECNQFADVVNRNQAILEAFETEINNFSRNASQAETLEEIRSAASQYVDAVDEVTDNLSGLVTDLEALSFSDNQLSTYRTDYVAVVSGFNSALSIVSSAMGGVAEADSESALSESLQAVQTDTVEAVDQIEGLATDESEIIDNVNEYCGAS